MPHFTCITEIRNSFYLKQVECEQPDVAVREAVASLPYDDGEGPIDEELEWLQSVARAEVTVTLHPVGHCKNTWLWLEGARYEPQYLMYVIKTDVQGT